MILDIIDIMGPGGGPRGRRDRERVGFGNESSFPAPMPNPRVGKGLVTLERFLGVTIPCQYARCYATGCKIVALHSDWLAPKQES